MIIANEAVIISVPLNYGKFPSKNVSTERPGSGACAHPGVDDVRGPGIDPDARPVWANAFQQKRLPCAEEQELRSDDDWFTRWFDLV